MLEGLRNPKHALGQYVVHPPFLPLLWNSNLIPCRIIIQLRDRFRDLNGKKFSFVQYPIKGKLMVKPFDHSKTEINPVSSFFLASDRVSQVFFKNILNIVGKLPFEDICWHFAILNPNRHKENKCCPVSVFLLCHHLHLYRENQGNVYP